MANKTIKQLGGLVYFITALMLFISPIAVKAAPYGDGTYNDCKYNEGCDAVTPTPTPTPDEDDDPDTPDLYTGPTGQNFATNTDVVKNKPKTETKTKDPDTTETTEEEPAEADIPGENLPETENNVPKIAFYIFLVLLAIGIIWWLLAAKRRSKDQPTEHNL